MKKVLRGLAVLILAAAVLMAYRQAGVAGNGVAGDACQNPMAPKLSVPVAISTATTTKLVDAVAGFAGAAGQAIDVCNFSMTVAGTTPTVQFEYGTKASTDCDTGATTLTGAYAPTAGTHLVAGFSGTLFATPQSKQLCMVSVGTGFSAQGVLTYALQ